jgi:predicted RNase H-like HicB family nuclease
MGVVFAWFPVHAQSERQKVHFRWHFVQFGAGREICSGREKNPSPKRSIQRMEPHLTVGKQIRVRHIQAMKLTAVFVPCPEGGFAAFVEELPGANSQAETLEEARANLREAVQMVIEGNRLLAEEGLAGTDAHREELILTSAENRGI